MADNITLNSNTTSGPVLATDQIGGVHYQINKLAYGANDTVTSVDASNPLPITIISQPATTSIPSGANVIGKVSIDQTTPGVTESVTIKASGGIGSLTEIAPASDTASSGLNGRLQRIAQNITSLISLLPTSLGIKTSAASLSITPASDAVFKLNSGTSIIGKVGFDQTLDGSTNGVSITSYSGNISNATTSVYASSLVVKAAAGKLISVKGYNAKTTPQFIQIHDTATVPADGSIPKVIYSVPAQSNFEISFNVFGRSFTSGIVLCNSSTGPTKTIGVNDVWFDVSYI